MKNPDEKGFVDLHNLMLNRHVRFSCLRVAVLRLKVYLVTLRVSLGKL